MRERTGRTSRGRTSETFPSSSSLAPKFPRTDGLHRLTADPSSARERKHEELRSDPRLGLNEWARLRVCGAPEVGHADRWRCRSDR